MEPDELRRTLDPAQVRAVEATDRTLRILAGAGSGKTRVLTARLAHRAATGSLDPRHALAITFTRQAAAELRRRIGELGVRDLPASGTFHAVALGQLRQWWVDRARPEPRIVAHKPSFVARLLPAAQAPLATGLAAELEWAAARLVTPEAYTEAARRAGRRPPLPPDRVAEIYAAYRREKRQKGVVDFDDLLGTATAVLRDDPRTAAAWRWRYRHVLVDEFQDLNPLQFDLLQAWLGDDHEPDLCVVGDPNQAVYGWNGADNRYLVGLERWYPSVATVELDRNHRSTPEVLALAGAVLGARAPRAMRGSGARPTLTTWDDEGAEAAGVAARVRDVARTPGRSWSSQAVLVRTHAQATAVAAALEAVGVPAELRTRALRDDTEGRGGDEPGRAPDAPAPPPDAVAVATFHAAKGLEWPVVHVAGLEEGLVPHATAAAAEALAEERRLLYVALTRARQELHLSRARTRTFRGTRRERRPTRWLDAAAALVDEAQGVPAGVGRSPRVAASRPPTGSPVPPGGGAAGAGATPAERAAATGRHVADPLFDALAHWRDTQARAARVPASVVATDDALAALARARPTTPAELAEVTGIGPVKAARFGDTLLAIVAASCSSASDRP